MIKTEKSGSERVNNPAAVNGLFRPAQIDRREEYVIPDLKAAAALVFPGDGANGRKAGSS